ncbi:putative quinol monooxygenase [Parvibaculum sp.]|uniref:putative quinol monooxygenase n=1 Tax=Parvibaculum sp. TaxID=2024848 RepID=UPI0034A06B68
MPSNDPSAPSVCVIVIARARDGRRRDVLAAFKRSKSLMAQTAGCLRFDVHYGIDDPKTVMVHEVWQSIAQHREAFSQVTGSAAFSEFRKLLESDLALSYFHEA